jgi:hypothetical protein
MGTVSAWLKRNFPDSYEFIRNFFKALNNLPGGHSLRKWLSIGVFWVLSVVCIRYTDNTNVVSIATVLSGLMTSLVITNTVGNHYALKTENSNKPTDEPNSGDKPQD